MKIFDVNGHIGEGARGSGDFPCARELIRHMDYLGIDRSLVWHVEARDLSPTHGNRKLLTEITENEMFTGRLIPAFVAAPSNFYEYGAMAALLRAFGEAGLRALRIFPQTSRFEMRTIERVLREIEEFQPVILWNFRDSNSFTDCIGFGELAEKFPKMNFALTELMWPQFNSAMDLLWRARNIYIDISWLHMRDTIELLRDEFGAERMLFGTGFKAHYGGAISALAHAKLSKEERALIFSGNAERLLGLNPLEKKMAGGHEMLNEKPRWKSFREGRPLEDIEVIDAHGHSGPHTRGWILRDIEPRDNISNMLKQMDSCGVSTTVVAPETGLFSEPASGNSKAEKLMSKHPGRFMGYLVFNPWYRERLQPLLDDFFSGGFFIGFKLLPSYWKVPVEDEGYEPVWKYADMRRMPVLIHTWDDRYNAPRMLADIAPAYPGAKFILGHSGGGGRGRAEAVELAVNNPNVFLEFCGSFTTPVDWRDTIKSVGIEKVVFGSDSGAHSLAWELGRFLSIPIPDEKLLPALAESFKNILKEREAEPPEIPL